MSMLRDFLLYFAFTLFVTNRYSIIFIEFEDILKLKIVRLDLYNIASRRWIYVIDSKSVIETNVNNYKSLGADFLEMIDKEN